jgi:hypothetical protein
LLQFLSFATQHGIASDSKFSYNIISIHSYHSRTIALRTRYPS